MKSWRSSIENRENVSFINEGKIIRLGIPTVEDETFNQMLIDKVVEKKDCGNKETHWRITDSTQLNQNTLRKYERAEQSALKNKSLREAQTREYQKNNGKYSILAEESWACQE